MGGVCQHEPTRGRHGHGRPWARTGRYSHPSGGIMWRTLTALSAALVVLAANASGQIAPGTPQDPSPEPTANPWAFNASAYTYLLPDDKNYVNLNFTADRGWLHLEARYNYEAQKAGSLWVGRNFSFGDKVAFEVTPMIGGVFGNLNGIAPGYNLS